MRPAIVGQCESRGTYFTFNQAVHSFLGQKGQKTFFFSVFEAELAHAESPGPYNLQAILSSDIKTDSSLKCVIFDPGGATGLIRRDPVNCGRNVSVDHPTAVAGWPTGKDIPTDKENCKRILERR